MFEIPVCMSELFPLRPKLLRQEFISKSLTRPAKKNDEPVGETSAPTSKFRQKEELCGA